MAETGLTTIGLTAALSSVGTLGITWFGHFLGERRERRLRKEEHERQATYLAVRVVCILDPFIMECCAVVEDEGEYDPQGERHAQVSEPRLELPGDIEWKSVEPDLSYRILSLPNEIESSEKSISWVATVLGFPPDYDEVFEERGYQYAKLGLAALDLADELRATYRLPPREYGKWEPRRYLEGASKKIDEERAMANVAFKVAQDLSGA